MTDLIGKIILADCMDIMADMPDDYIDLAIVDPPYFEGAGDPKYYNPNQCESKHKPIKDTWCIPDEKYFNLLFRISKKQIIWGCNYYAKHIPHPGRIIWDKKNDGSPFSQAEIASYSEGVKVYMFRYLWNGMLQENMKEKQKRIHPTEKPIQLYRWLLQNYAKPGQLILDTHSGSGSLACACHLEKFDFIAIEKDKDYHRDSVNRLDELRSQGVLF